VRRFGVEKALVTDTRLAAAGGEFGTPKADDLLAAIGYGKVTARAVLTRIVGQDALREKAPDGALTSVVKRVFGGGEHKIRVRGIDDLLVVRARCCNPIRGEKIVGYITRGKGVSVHTATCPNVINLMYDPDRRIDVEWDKDTDISPYTVRLRISVEDRRGILADVSSRVAGINTNIRDVEATVGEDHRGIDPHDCRDQRPSSPREGHEVDQSGRGRTRGGEGEHGERALTGTTGTGYDRYDGYGKCPRFGRKFPSYRLVPLRTGRTD
jgi:GTP pyrophosphokinase